MWVVRAPHSSLPPRVPIFQERGDQSGTYLTKPLGRVPPWPAYSSLSCRYHNVTTLTFFRARVSMAGGVEREKWWKLLAPHNGTPPALMSDDAALHKVLISQARPGQDDKRAEKLRTKAWFRSLWIRHRRRKPALPLYIRRFLSLFACRDSRSHHSVSAFKTGKGKKNCPLALGCWWKTHRMFYMVCLFLSAWQIGESDEQSVGGKPRPQDLVTLPYFCLFIYFPFYSRSSRVTPTSD